MPRRPRPWYRSDRMCFQVQVGGKRITLLPDAENTPENAALAGRILAGMLAEDAAPPPSAPLPAIRTVAQASVDYLRSREKKLVTGEIGVRCIRNYRITLRQFVATFGERAIAGFTADEIELWAFDQPTWSQSYRHNALGTVAQLFKWARCPLIDADSGKERVIVRPPKESRGAESVITDEQFAAVLRHAEHRSGGGQGDLGPLLRLLRETGARPCEVVGLTVESVDWPNCCQLLQRHKTYRHTGKARPLVFASAAMIVLDGQRAKYGTGPLFRTKRSNPWTPNGVVKRLLTISERVGFRAIAYGLGRHSFATAALVNGVPDAMVAGLLGQAGTGMLARHYSHVTANARAMHDAAERARIKAG